MGFPLVSPKVQYFDSSGHPLAGGKLYTKVAGGASNKTTWSDAPLTTPNTNPVILNARGEASVFAAAGEVFWLRLTDSSDVTIWTADNQTFPGTTEDLPYYPISAAETAAGILDASLTHTYNYGDIRRYGADPTGVADSTAFIQAALDANNAVYIPTGTFKTTMALNWHPNTKIYGDSHGVSKLLPYGVNFFALKYDREGEGQGPHGCVFEDFFIDGTNMTGTAAYTCGGIHWTDASHSSAINRVRIRNYDNANNVGIYITGQCYYLVVNQPEIVNCTIGILLNGNELTASQPTAAINSIEIYAPRLKGNAIAGGSGIALVNANHTKIIGGQIEDYANYGITADSDCDFTHIEGVWFEQNIQRDIRFNGNTNGTICRTYHYRSTADITNIPIELVGAEHHVYDIDCANRVGATSTKPIYFNTATSCIVERVSSDLGIGTANIYSGTLGSNRVIDYNAANTQESSGNYRNFIGGLRIGDSTTNDVNTFTDVFMAVKGGGWNPGNITTGTSTTTTLTVTGAALGQTVIMSFGLDLNGCSLTGYVSATDTVTAVLTNNTGSDKDLGSGELRAMVIKWAP